MTQENYQTIFELGFRSFPWASVGRLLIFIASGLLLARLFKSKSLCVVVGLFVASIASLILLASLVVFVPNFIKQRSSYVSGKSSLVEGVVENFHPAPTLGPARETFSVHGILFSYNALDDMPCFHDAPLHGGPLREGLGVRIHYYEGCIQRIDVLQRAVQ
jgi:hypothetical protein